MLPLRALAVWLILIAAGFIHGIVRTILLVPIVGEFPARQIGVFTGSLLILLMAYLFTGWMNADNGKSLILVGLLWLVLTLLFDLCFGHFVSRRSWINLAFDNHLSQGGLLPIGLVVLVFSPWIAARFHDFIAMRLPRYLTITGSIVTAVGIWFYSWSDHYRLHSDSVLVWRDTTLFGGLLVAFIGALACVWRLSPWRLAALAGLLFATTLGLFYVLPINIHDWTGILILVLYGVWLFTASLLLLAVFRIVKQLVKRKPENLSIR